MASIITTAAASPAASRSLTLIDAALRDGSSTEQGCRSGRCGTCKSQSADNGPTVAFGVEPAPGAHDAAPLQPARTWPCRISTLRRVSPNVLKIVVRLPPTSAFAFQAGQSIELIGPRGLRRHYFIANAPAADSSIELHVRRVDHGAMSDHWFNVARVDDLLRLHGPLGTPFQRDPAAGRDLVFLATGIGIARVKAMLEALQSSPQGRRPRSVSVYWGVRTQADLYWSPEVIDLQHRFVPVLSREEADWRGARGHVQQALLADSPDMSRKLVHACGPEEMVVSARQLLLACGLAAEQFRSAVSGAGQRHHDEERPA